LVRNREVAAISKGRGDTGKKIATLSRSCGIVRHDCPMVMPDACLRRCSAGSRTLSLRVREGVVIFILEKYPGMDQSKGILRRLPHS
jgi:hypothetical protein